MFPDHCSFGLNELHSVSGFDVVVTYAEAVHDRVGSVPLQRFLLDDLMQLTVGHIEQVSRDVAVAMFDSIMKDMGVRIETVEADLLLPTLGLLKVSNDFQHKCG